MDGFISPNREAVIEMGYKNEDAVSIFVFMEFKAMKDFFGQGERVF